MEQNTVEWLEFRRTHIGSSDASAIMGISPWDTPYKKWEEKVFGKTKEKTVAMNRGSIYEEEARLYFEKMTGISVMPKVIISSEREWQMASLDGISFDGKTFVEIKIPNKKIHEDAKKEIIPDYYNVQMQHQYATDNDLNDGLYFSYLPATNESCADGIIVEVRKDEALIEKIIKEEEKFLYYMKNKEPPTLTDKDYVFQDNPKWMQVAEEWKEINSSIKSLEEKEEQLRKLLIGMTAGQSSKGAGIRVTRSICKGNVDYKRIPELINVDLEPYRKDSIQKWTLATCK